MTAAMAVSSMSMAVNVFAEEDTTEEAAESEEPADRKSTRLNSSHSRKSRMPSSA